MAIRVGDRDLTLGLGMLSWRAPATVDQTLASYAAAGIFDVFDHVLVYFQEISEADRAAAAKYGLACAGNQANTGIYGGVKALLEAMEDDYVLFVENDCLLIEDRAAVVRQTEQAVRDLERGLAQVYRMRHRRHPGEGFETVDKYLRYHPPGPRAWQRRRRAQRLVARLRALARPFKAERLKGIAAYVEENPEQRFPKVFRRTPEGNLLVRSRHLNWTNQAILFSRRWVLEELLPWVAAHPSRRTVNGFPDIEKELNSRWWRTRGFTIGISPGLFTHRRLDR